MGYKIKAAPMASKDLDAIVTYMAEELGNPAAAVSFLDEVDACYTNLESMPFLYEVCRDPYLKTLQYRHALIKGYVMIYRVEEAEKTVQILRFFHGTRNYEKLL